MIKELLLLLLLKKRSARGGRSGGGGGHTGPQRGRSGARAGSTEPGRRRCPPWAAANRHAPPFPRRTRGRPWEWLQGCARGSGALGWRSAHAVVRSGHGAALRRRLIERTAVAQEFVSLVSSDLCVRRFVLLRCSWTSRNVASPRSGSGSPRAPHRALR